MKLVAIILLSVCLAASASGHSQGITISKRNADLQTVLKEISRQSGYQVFFNERLLREAGKVTMDLRNVTVEQALQACFHDQPFSYAIVNKTIVVKKAERQTSSNNQSQENINAPPLPLAIDVTGRVTDEDGNGLLDANVKVKGSDMGTNTNAEGYFVLRGVDEKAILEITYIGFEKRELSAASARALRTIVLKRNDSPLDALQIIAYGKTTRRLSTGNTGTVTAEEIEKQPVSNPLLALQGRIPGVEITQTTGVNNGHVRIRIQGQNNIVQARGEPLVVIDGIPYPTFSEPDGTGSPVSNDAQRGASPLSFINPLDIESIDILKDADATSIYGSRGANGVVLITTKKGKPGKIKINAGFQQGWGRVTRKANMMNTREYLDMRYEAFRNDGLSPNLVNNPDLRDWDTTRYTDWQEVLIGGTAKNSRANISLSGGTETVQYLIGGTYRRDTDVFPGDMASTSGSLHFNINTASLNQKFKLQLSGSYLVNENLLPGVDLTQAALSLEPVAPALFNPDGSLNWAPNAAGSSTWDNPLQHILFRNVEHLTKNLVSSAVVSYVLLPGVHLKSTFGYNASQGSNFRAATLDYSRPENRATSTRQSFRSESANNTWIIEPQLSFQPKLGRVKVDGVVGGTIQKNTNSFLRVTASGFTSDLLMKSLGAATSVTGSSGDAQYRYAALFGRLNLNLDNKYIVNVNARRDGSSRFGDANKYHTFASAAGAWIFTEEKLFKEALPFLSYGKLRASYGVTGSDNISNYAYLGVYTSNSLTLPYQGISALNSQGLSNRYIQWEEVNKQSYGIELGVFQDRIILGASYNRNRCSNQLLLYRLPSTTGFTTISQNFPATVQNTSWEFMLDAKIVKTKEVNWSAALNFTLPDNKVIAFPDYENSSYASGNNGIIPGQPVGVIKAYHYAGVDPLTGTGVVYDVNGNPTLSPSAPTDNTILFNPLPDFTGGLNNRFSYKSFQLSFLFHFIRALGAATGYYYNSISPAGRFQLGRSNQPVSVINNRWQQPGDQAEMVRFSSGASVVPRALSSDVFYSYAYGSYIRLENLALSWQLPAKFINRIGLQSCAINMQGQNLFTFTGFTNLDPENGSAGNATPNNLPPLRVLTFGIQLGF
ncbi:MAG: SusC/RagA family TonB-linked outer membrane protein [Niabella sp.]